MQTLSVHPFSQGLQRGGPEWIFDAKVGGDSFEYGDDGLHDLPDASTSLRCEVGQRRWCSGN